MLCFIAHGGCHTDLPPSRKRTVDVQSTTPFVRGPLPFHSGSADSLLSRFDINPRHSVKYGKCSLKHRIFVDSRMRELSVSHPAVEFRGG